MEVKEAIELLSSERDDYSYPPIKDAYNSVILLLRQGEENKKYKPIVGELKVFYGNGILENEGGIGVQLKNLIEMLEQKYLKEANPNEADETKDNRK